MFVQIQTREWRLFGLFAILLAMFTIPLCGAAAQTDHVSAGAVIPSPSEGFFYAGEQPGDSPLVQVGSLVRPDTVVGYVQSMDKVPVLAGTTGTIVEILVQDMKPVSFGQALFRVSTSS